MMSKQQTDYAMRRAREIFLIRGRELDASFAIKPVTLSLSQKLAALKGGRFKIVGSVEEHSYGSVRDYIKFDGEVEAGFKHGHKPAKDKLEATYSKLCDELVLGDESEALKLLRKFEVA